MNPLFAQDFWESVPLPDTVDVQCFAMNNQGDMFFGSGNIAPYGGLYRSTDNGETWELLYNSGMFTVNAVELANSGSIYISTNNGWECFLVSNDNGISWNNITNLPGSFRSVSGIWCLETDTIYVGIRDSHSCSILARTYDNGQSWDSLFYFSDCTSSITDIIRIDNQRMYLSTNGFFYGMGGVYYSEDYGETWDFDGLPGLMVHDLDITSNGDIIAIAPGETGGSLGPGFYIKDHESGLWELLVSGYGITTGLCTDEDHFYFRSTSPNGIYRSLDYGENFSLIMEGYPNIGGGEMIKLGLDGRIYSYGTHLVRSIESTSVGDYEISRSENNIVTIFPNPVNEITTFGYKLKSEGSVQVKIFATDGTPIQILNEGYKNKGSHEVTYNSSSLDAGIYYCSLVVDGAVVETRKMVVVR